MVFLRYFRLFFGPNVIAEKLGINGVIFELIILTIFALPWNFTSAMLADKLGRKALQAIGFTGMGLFTLIFAFLIGKISPIVTLSLYGFSTVFSQIGPGTIVGFWGVELFPATVRGLTQGITVLGGRMGVLTTTFLFPIILNAYGIVPTMVILAIVSFLGAITTMFLPEPKQRSLTEFERLGEELESK
ncbi:hypothetical protein SJAV_09420 [Sulfurisphaera javensis]|uniref:Major facilitator superfamily (MFS) profile domain-containing protein n=1 Tax=Sulfurisphaera javensis TaxID=2049879 RepID=A0AAT9GQ81_9CREN